jgi:ribosomal protein L37AE/L43A
MQDLSAVLASIKTASDIAKLVKDSSTSLQEAEVKLKMAELVSALADAKIEMAEIKTILQNKDGEIDSLKSLLEIKSSVIWQEPYYFVVDEDTKKDGPFCQKCYDSDQKLIRLQIKTKGLYRCLSCKNIYKDSEYEPPNKTQRNRRVTTTWMSS